MKNKLIKLLGGYTREDIKAYSYTIINHYVYESLNKKEGTHISIKRIIEKSLKTLKIYDLPYM